LSIAAVLLLSLAAGGLAAARGIHAQGTGSSVEIHLRTCLTGYSGNDLYEDCHDNPTAGVSFELGGLRSTTNDAGDVAFGSLNAGTYAVTANIPGEFVETNVYCSIDGDPSQMASYESIRGGIRLTVPENTAIVCDWYTIPHNLQGAPGDGDPSGGSSILIHARACPVGYTGSNPYADCHDLPAENVTFELDGLSTTTGTNGNALFYQLNPLTFTMRTAGEGNFSRHDVFCSLEQDISQQVPVTAVDGGVEIDVPQNTAIICDWYIVPESGASGEGGTVTLHKVQCPAGYEGSAYFADCHENRLEGVSFDAYGPEGYLVQDVQSGPDGTLVFDGITVGGTVTIREELPAGTAVYVVYCSDSEGARAPFDYQDTPEHDGIRLYVSPSDDLLCDWYNIPAA
jgi:hypothetical protein